MGGAFLYLTICSLRNRVRVRIKRLREPRYLVGLVAGVLYMYVFVFRNAFRSSRNGRPAVGVLAAMSQAAAPVQAIASAVLFVFAALAWLWPGSRPALSFTRAEVQFLFQAPLTRRQLVHYKLIRSQVGTIFGSAITTLFLRPGSLAMGWTSLVGIWITFSIIGLHSIGISLSRQSVAKTGPIGLAKQWLPFTALIGAIGVLAVTLAGDWSQLMALATPREVVGELQRLATTGAAGVVLWPFRAIVRVPLAGSPAEFWAALPWALLILAANYLWVLQADAAFEEASAARAEHVAARLAAIRAGRLSTPSVRTKTSTGAASATPFTLSLTGRPETAILWKNLIMIGRYVSLKTLWRIVPFLILIGVIASQGHRSGLLPVLATLCIVAVGFTLLLGPQISRNDLRQDLSNLAVLKTWPVSGAELVRGELLAPAVVLTVISWILVIAATLLSGRLDVSAATATAVALHKISYALAAMLIAPGLILAQLVVQNGLAIMFPAWVALGANRARGIEATGQRLLMMAGNLLTLALSLLPGVIVGGVIALAVYWMTGVVLIVIPAFVLAAFMLAECWLAVEALGRLLERTDVSALEAIE